MKVVSFPNGHTLWENEQGEPYLTDDSGYRNRIDLDGGRDIEATERAFAIPLEGGSWTPADASEAFYLAHRYHLYIKTRTGTYKVS